MSPSLDKFFHPKSVVIVEASATPHKPGNDVIRNIHANGFRGTMYLASPKGEEILGMKAFPTVKGIPEPVDMN